MNLVLAKDAPAARNERLSIRTTPEEKSLVERAAEASRLNMSQFVMQAAVRSAESVLADQTRFTLGTAQWEAFSEALDRPAREIAQLSEAAARKTPFSAR